LDKLNISTCPQGVGSEKGKNMHVSKNFFEKNKKSPFKTNGLQIKKALTPTKSKD